MPAHSSSSRQATHNHGRSSGELKSSPAHASTRPSAHIHPCYCAPVSFLACLQSGHTSTHNHTDTHTTTTTSSMTSLLDLPSGSGSLSKGHPGRCRGRVFLPPSPPPSVSPPLLPLCVSLSGPSSVLPFCCVQDLLVLPPRASPIDVMSSPCVFQGTLPTPDNHPRSVPPPSPGLVPTELAPAEGQSSAG